MSKKRKGRRRPAPGSRAGTGTAARSGTRKPDPSTTAAEPQTARRSARASASRPARQRLATTDRPRRAAATGRSRSAPGPAVVLPVGRSLASGIAAVGSGPALLDTAFLGAFALWLLYSTTLAVRVVTTGTLAHVESLAPVHTFLDLQFISSVFRELSPAATVLIGAGLLLLRAGLTGMWTALAAQALADRPEALPEARQPALARVAAARRERSGRTPGSSAPSPESPQRRALQAMPVLSALEVLFLVVVSVLGVILGSVLGLVGLLLVLVAGMYFLVYAPVVAVVEQTGLVRAIRLSVGAGRANGRQHLLLSSGYVIATLYLYVLLSGDRFADATPSVTVWAVILVTSLVHVSFLAALTHRWLAMRETVIAATKTGAGGKRVRARRATGELPEEGDVEQEGESPD